MADGLRIQVTNASNLLWTRNIFEVGAGSVAGLNWTDELSQTPSSSLAPHSGSTIAAADQVWMTSLMRDALYLQLGYYSRDGAFAVHCRQQFHLLTLGPGCLWRVLDRHGWNDRGTDTQQYSWNCSSTRVVATPTLTNTTASIDVLITNVIK